jgi:signal peptidase II
MTPKLRILIAMLLFTVPSDQLSKAWVAAHVGEGVMADRIPVVDGLLYITHVRNTGAAFGLLRDWPEAWRLVAFAIVSVIAIAVILSFYRSLAPGERFNTVALGLVMGGALGNAIDRVLHGSVIDFIHVRIQADLAWPDFNLADSFIVVGVVTLMLELLVTEGASRAGSGNAT